MWSVRKNIAGDKGNKLKDISVYKYARKRKKERELNKRKPQTPEGTETEIKSITGHWVQKKQQKKKNSSEIDVGIRTFWIA